MISLQDFCPVIEDSPLYSGISLQVSPGEILPVMGKSGSGKTSLFRAMRGDIDHRGQADLDHDMIFSIFQSHDQLLPWYTNQRNLDLVCKKPYHELAKQWQVDLLLPCYPDRVSVGQRQRLTLIRALCSGRCILLCDEPLSAVDGITALQIAHDFRRIVAMTGVSCLWITHNMSEAKLLNQRVVVIKDKQTCLHDRNDLEKLFSITD